MTPFRADAVEAELRACLRGARRFVHWRNVWVALVAAVQRAAWTAVFFAAFFLLARIGMALGGVPATSGLKLYPWVLAAAIVVVVLAGVLPAALSAPGWNEAAERLDLAAKDHNRIATALALACVSPQSVFAQAAMLDGLEYARRLSRHRPFLPAPYVRGRRLLGVAGAAVALHAAALLVRAGGAPGTSGESALVAGVPAGLARVSAESPSPRQRSDQPTIAGQQTARAKAVAAQRAPTAERARPAPPLNPPTAAGAPGRGGSGQPSPYTSAGGLTAATGGSSRSERTAARPHPVSAATRLPDTPRAPDRAAEDVSPISPGASGGAAASPVSHDWAQREASAEREDEATADEPIEDEQSVNAQRGGLQPLLKDRQESPSRELGMSGPPEGPPGTGRGGPTPPKKSRGTASLVLGVPVPDFVRGKVGPGTTRVVQEQISPVAMPGPPAGRMAVRARSTPEAAVPRPEVLGELAAVIRDYLIALHSADRLGSSDVDRARGEDSAERSEP